MNRNRRTIRSGSSENETAGPIGVRSVSDARSARPPNGSMSTGSPSPSFRATALTVKSRRSRSASTESPNVTTGRRLSDG